MQKTERAMPLLVKEANQLPFDYADMDFEPFDEFLSEESTGEWIRAWTGNQSLDGKEYLIFGQDASGGHVAFWCIRSTAPITEQPVVFFGSEGDVGVLANTFSDYLWLLAGGFGPYEALEYSLESRTEQPAFAAFATLHGGPKKTPSEVLSLARIEFPGFEEKICALCMY